MEENKQLDTSVKDKTDKPNEDMTSNDIRDMQAANNQTSLSKNGKAATSMNILALAFMGDAVYESAVRKYILLSNPFLKVNELHKRAVSYVKASAQAEAVIDMLHNEFLTEQEVSVVKRARNHASNTPKNADVSDYRYATGLEALIGHLHLKGEENRAHQIIDTAISFISKSMQIDNK